MWATMLAGGLIAYFLPSWMTKKKSGAASFTSRLPLSTMDLAASYITFIAAILGSSEMRWVESLIAAAVMTAFCVALFVYLLQLPFQLWPWFI